MKTSQLFLVILVGIQVGCTTVVDHQDSDRKYRVRYKDTNKDGYVDAAFFTPGGIDGDFVMKDTDFDGRYESATVIGVGISHKTVDYPVYLDEAKARLNRSFLSP